MATTPRASGQGGPSEASIHIAFVAWFRACYPNVMILHVPNGGLRHPAVANQLKALGTVPGVPDLFIPRWDTWIELKTPKGRLSPVQRTTIAWLERDGHDVYVFHGVGDAERDKIEELAARHRGGREGGKGLG